MRRAFSGDFDGTLRRHSGRLVLAALFGVAVVTSWGGPGWAWIAQLAGQ